MVNQHYNIMQEYMINIQIIYIFEPGNIKKIIIQEKYKNKMHTFKLIPKNKTKFIICYLKII